jgi:hypothetical protein
LTLAHELSRNVAKGQPSRSGGENLHKIEAGAIAFVVARTIGLSTGWLMSEVISPSLQSKLDILAPKTDPKPILRCWQ